MFTFTFTLLIRKGGITIARLHIKLIFTLTKQTFDTNLLYEMLQMSLNL